MAGQTIELNGVGDIYSGEQLLRRTSYHLQVSSGGLSILGTPAPPTITGSIDITGMGEAVVLAGAEYLTLQLEDGRRLSFILTSTDGRIQVQGGFQPAAGGG